MWNFLREMFELYKVYDLFIFKRAFGKQGINISLNFNPKITFKKINQPEESN